MDVILLENLGRLGKMGDQVKVRAGFARNYLLPQGKALAANQQNIADFQARRADLEKVAQDKLQTARMQSLQLVRLDQIVIKVRTASEGKLYGAVGSMHIVDALDEAGVTIEKRHVQLPEGPLQALGEYAIDIQLHPEVTVPISVCVAPVEVI